MTQLFTPLEGRGFIPLRNRAVMSAMSRSHADTDHRPTVAMRNYYERRALGGVGLILTEGTIIHPSGDGWKGAPHIATKEQAAAWRPVVEAVHAGGAAIACQLWHMGRISHAEFTGRAPVSSTNRAAAGLNRQNNKPYGRPRPLEASEIPTIYAHYTDAACRALDAGFDAVELHMGHGYLPDQFLDGNVNDRGDEYGGSVENRCRFALELVERVLKTVPAERVIARISPSRFMDGVYDWPDLEKMLAHLVPALDRIGLRALDVSCANSDYFQTSALIVRTIRPLYRGVIMAGASLTQAQAEQELALGHLDCVTWGRAFIANPDLITRFRQGTEPRPFDDSMRATLI